MDESRGRERVKEAEREGESKIEGDFTAKLRGRTVGGIQMLLKLFFMWSQQT